MSKKITQADREKAAWVCNYWAHQLFSKWGECPEVWLYLFWSEACKTGD
jgi:hypothetical protein